ncbi:MAG: DUF445 domain-containing protein [Actinomycetota bacterium]|nr:DUF445 domain-containing protein [Actinomycetota bacterium]
MITQSVSEAGRARQLRVTRRQAGGLLLAVTAIFVVSTAFAGSHRWLVWVQATAVAAMVGGLADWFAVTALFRRPLGLPIPHTAIVVERKDRFGETLGAFVQESFLSAEAVTERLRSAHALDRSTSWLADPGNADLLAGRLLEIAATAADLVANDDVHELFDSLARGRLDDVALAPAAGRVLDELTRDERHQPLVDAALAGLCRYLETHGADLHRRLGRRSPWWLPGPVESRVVNRFMERSRVVLSDMAGDRSHPLRIQINEGLVTLAHDLQSSPELRRRGAELTAELLAQPQLRATALTVWEDAKKHLRVQIDDPASPLRSRVTDVVTRGAGRFRRDPALVEATERAVESALATTLERFQTELASLVSGTIARWDAAETSRRLELLLGPDLQYIRINGTVVGGLAGLVLHGVTRLLG